jgi:LacI family transcriptional regulator
VRLPATDPATINDVARRAGVSKSTVSNVVRRPDVVSAATRERVEAAIRDLGYRPNAIARALRQRSTRVIGTVVPDQRNPFYAELVRGAERRAHSEGFGLLIANTGGDPETEHMQISALLERRVDAILVAGLCAGSQAAREIADRGVPVVLGGFRTESGDRVGIVDIDEEAALDAIVAHLHGLGHTRLAFAHGAVGEAGSERRERAFAQALARRGLERVDLGDEPTAIVAHDDTVAIEQIDRIERSGRHVPDDVSVVGFDDIPLASHQRIALTTVRTDAAALGARSAELLIAAAQSGTLSPTRETHAWQLVVRSSTARPSPGAAP